jgi:hypothetical protein
MIPLLHPSLFGLRQLQPNLACPILHWTTPRSQTGCAQLLFPHVLMIPLLRPSLFGLRQLQPNLACPILDWTMPRSQTGCAQLLFPHVPMILIFGIIRTRAVFRVDPSTSLNLVDGRTLLPSEILPFSAILDFSTRSCWDTQSTLSARFALLHAAARAMHITDPTPFYCPSIGCHCWIGPFRMSLSLYYVPRRPSTFGHWQLQPVLASHDTIAAWMRPPSYPHILPTLIFGPTMLPVMTSGIAAFG